MCITVLQFIMNKYFILWLLSIITLKSLGSPCKNWLILQNTHAFDILMPYSYLIFLVMIPSPKVPRTEMSKRQWQYENNPSSSAVMGSKSLNPVHNPSICVMPNSRAKFLNVIINYLQCCTQIFTTNKPNPEK